MTLWTFDHTSVAFGAGAQGALVSALAQAPNVPSSSPYTLQPIDHLRTLQSGSVSGTLTINLPAPGTLPSGFTCWVMRNSHNIVLSPAGGVGLAVPTLGFITSAITLSQQFQAYMLAYDGTNFYVWPLGGVAPTFTSLLSGSGTYNTPPGCLWLHGRMCAGGGGGGGANANNGSDGSQTTFGAWTVNPGHGGLANVSASVFGGTSGTDGVGIRVERVPGGNGQGSYASNMAGWGGGNRFTAPTPTAINTAGINAPANTGGGGSGGAFGGTAAGSGGGAGECVEFIWPNPPATIAYSAGPAGAGGAAGGNPGGNGGSGAIYLRENYA